MSIPTIIIMLIFVTTPLFMASQETPENRTEEPIAQPQKYQDDIDKQDTPSELKENTYSNANQTEQETSPSIDGASTQDSNPTENTEQKTNINEEKSMPKEIIDQDELMINESLSQEPIGIDTVSLENPQGNWLFKRIWWERAEEKYEKIRILVDAIWEQRNEFFKQRNQLDRNILDPFYMNVGIGRGELQAILSEITDFLEQQREQQSNLSEQERGLYETYIQEEETLKQLKVDVDIIANLDQAIDDALGTFMNQINRVKNYESEAWKNFKEIAHILNDVRARELYYMIEGATRNIKTISIYLEQDFFTHFQKLIEEIKTRVSRVQNQMDALKEKGVLFQKQTEQPEQQQTIMEDQEGEDDNQETKPKPKVGLFDSVVNNTLNAFSYIWSILKMPYNMIFGK